MDEKSHDMTGMTAKDTCPSSITTVSDEKKDLMLSLQWVSSECHLYKSYLASSTWIRVFFFCVMNGFFTSTSSRWMTQERSGRGGTVGGAYINQDPAWKYVGADDRCDRSWKETLNVAGRCTHVSVARFWLIPSGPLLLLCSKQQNRLCDNWVLCAPPMRNQSRLESSLSTNE